MNEIDVNPDEEYISRIREILGETIATRFIDHTKILKMTEKARENRLVPE